MADLFLTGRGNVEVHPHTTNASFDYREAVCLALQELGVPLRPSEVAIIDLRYDVNVGFHNKCAPSHLAEMMLDRVTELYTDEDGTWHYTKKETAPIA